LTLKICVSISPETVDEALDLVEKAEGQGADFIEVRLDNFENGGKLSDVARCGRVPMIAANRSTREGGKFLGSETERKKILLKAAEKGFQYADVELSTAGLEGVVGKLREMGAKSIVSFHDFEGTPSLQRLERVLKREIDGGADVCKIVTTAKSIRDNLTVLNLISKACNSVRLVCFAMGEMGKASRVLSPLFGAFFTISSLEKGKETAPGQLTIRELRVVYEVLELI